MNLVNLYGDEWDAAEEHGDFGGRDAWVGRRLGAELIGGTVYEVDPSGAHQVINRSDTHARVLMLSTLLHPEVVEYPDSGKVGARDAKGERLFLSRPGPTLDYYDGEV